MNTKEILAVGHGLALFIHLGFIIYKIFLEIYRSRNQEYNTTSQNEEICKICQKVLHIDEQTLRLPCNDIFHAKCLHAIFKSRGNRRICPSCREPINSEFNLLESIQ